MATFYYQTHSNESWLEQWRKYIKSKPLINNIEDIVNNQTKDYKKIIAESTAEQVNAIYEASTIVCDTLDSGFEYLASNIKDVTHELGEIRSELNDISAMLDWNFSLVIEQQKITNLLLGNIAVLLRIPDIQKERQYHVEQGVKFLKKAINNSDFYQNALENLLEAKKREKTDFFVLHRLGIIYMYSPNHTDIIEAEKYFRESAKFAKAEGEEGMVDGYKITIKSIPNKLAFVKDLKDFLQTDLISAKTLADNPKLPISKSFTFEDANSFKNKVMESGNNIEISQSGQGVQGKGNPSTLQAAESYLYASRCCYIQGKFAESAQLSEDAINLVPSMNEAGFMQAKSLSLNGDSAKGANVLKLVIQKDRNYSVKSILDNDLRSKPSVRKMLDELRTETYNEAFKLLEEHKSIIVDGSSVQTEIEEIQNLINKKNYLDCKKAIDLMTITTERSFSNIFQDDTIKFNSQLKIIKDLKVELIEVKRKAINPDKYIPIINKLFVFLTQNTMWNFSNYKSILDVIDFKSGYTPKRTYSSLLQFINMERDYINKLVEVKNEIEKTYNEIWKFNSIVQIEEGVSIFIRGFFSSNYEIQTKKIGKINDFEKLIKDDTIRLHINNGWHKVIESSDKYSKIRASIIAYKRVYGSEKSTQFLNTLIGLGNIITEFKFLGLVKFDNHMETMKEIEKIKSELQESK